MASVPARTPSSKALTRVASTFPHLPHTRPTVDLDCHPRVGWYSSARPSAGLRPLVLLGAAFGPPADLILRAGPVVSPLRIDARPARSPHRFRPRSRFCLVG